MGEKEEFPQVTNWSFRPSKDGYLILATFHTVEGSDYKFSFPADLTMYIISFLGDAYRVASSVEDNGT